MCVYKSSSSESVKGSSLSLESIDDVEGSDGLSLGVLSVGDWISDDVFEETSQDKSGLVIDQRADSLDSSSSGKSSNGWFSDSHDGGFEWLCGQSLGSCFTGNFSKFTSFTSVDWSHYVIFLFYYKLIFNFLKYWLLIKNLNSSFNLIG